jgi:hypothetical protein
MLVDESGSFIFIKLSWVLGMIVDISVGWVHEGYLKLEIMGGRY